MHARLLTQFARPGHRLAEPLLTPDGMPLLGRGTQLTRRHLRLLYDMGVRVVVVEDEGGIAPWEAVPAPDAFLKALRERFAPVAHDRRQAALEDAVREVYLEFLAGLEEVG